MAGPLLTHRKSQLKLLADACRCRAPARIVLRRAAHRAREHESHLVALETDRVLVAAPRNPAIKYSPNGLPVDVFFRHGGQDYAFSADMRSLRTVHRGNAAAGTLLQLSLPLCVERRRQREHRRMSLPADQTVTAQLTNMAAPGPGLNVRVTDISDSGFGGTIDTEAGEQVHVGDFYRADFELPGETYPVGCVVRLIHYRQAAASAPAVGGWSFCAGDDPTLNEDNLAYLERRLVQCEPLSRPPVDAYPGTGR